MSDSEYYATLDRVNEAVLEATEQLKVVCRVWNGNRLKQGLKIEVTLGCLLDAPRTPPCIDPMIWNKVGALSLRDRIQESNKLPLRNSARLDFSGTVLAFPSSPTALRRWWIVSFLTNLGSNPKSKPELLPSIFGRGQRSSFPQPRSEGTGSLT